MEKPTLTDIQGVGKAAAERLIEAGYTRIDDIAGADPAKLAAVEGFTDERAQHTIDAAKILAGGDDDIATATSATSSAKPEVINMTTDKTEDKPAAETGKVEAKAETPKAEAVKTEAKPAAKKAPAKKTAAKKPAAKTAAKAAPKAAAAKATSADKAKTAAPKAAAKPAEKPAAKPEAKAAPKPAPLPASKPANTNTPSIFKEPGYIAAGVLLVLAAYGFAQQPSIQEYLGFSTTNSSSATTTAMTSEASAPAAESPSANATAPVQAGSPAVSGDFGRPNMPTHMNPSMPPQGMMHGMGPGMAQGNEQGMPNAPYGNPAFNGHPMYAPHMAPRQAAPAPTDGTDDTATVDQNVAAQHVAPPPPYGPYSYSGNRLYNQGYGNGSGSGYGQGYGDGDFSMNFAGRANTQAYGNGYNGYNANNAWNGYNAYGPHGYGPYGYAPYGPGPAPYARPQAPVQAPTPVPAPAQ